MKTWVICSIISVDFCLKIFFAITWTCCISCFAICSWITSCIVIAILITAFASFCHIVQPYVKVSSIAHGIPIYQEVLSLFLNPQDTNPMGSDDSWGEGGPIHGGPTPYETCPTGSILNISAADPPEQP